MSDTGSGILSMSGSGAGLSKGYGMPSWLVEMGLTDDWQHMLDSTTVRGHSQAAGAKGGLIRRLLVDRGGFMTIHARADAPLASS